MPNLIDRDAIMAKLQKRAHEWRGSFSGDAYRNAANMLKKEPGIEGCIVGHAYWESVTVVATDGYKNAELQRLARREFVCSNCRKSLDFPGNFCPYCGSRMDQQSSIDLQATERDAEGG